MCVKILYLRDGKKCHHDQATMSLISTSVRVMTGRSITFLYDMFIVMQKPTNNE